MQRKELLQNRMFYKVFHKASAAPQSTTSLNMDSRREITVLTKLVFKLHNVSFQRLQAYLHAITEAGNEGDFDFSSIVIVLS